MLALKRIWQSTMYTSVLLLSVLLVVDVVFCGDAEVSQTDNLQPPVLDAGNVDVTQTDNIPLVKLEKTHVDVTHTNNLLCISLESNEIDVSQSHNLLTLSLTSKDADITQNNNLLAVILGPNNADVTMSNNLIALPLTPNEPLSLTITSFTTTDQNGDPKTTFTQGNVVLFKVVIHGSGSQNILDALISAIAQDPAGTPIFLSYTFEDIQVGMETTVYLGTQIPYDGMLGQYTAAVNVFTRFLSQGGEPIIGGHEETTFTVS